MNTHSVSLTSSSSPAHNDVRLTGAKARQYLGTLTRWSLAGAVSLAVIIPGIWLATSPSLAQYVSAGLWALGFVFFALALEVNIRRIFPLISTGISLPVLALLGSRLAGEFLVLALALVAGWLAYWIAYRN